MASGYSLIGSKVLSENFVRVFLKKSVHAIKEPCEPLLNEVDWIRLK